MGVDLVADDGVEDRMCCGEEKKETPRQYLACHFVFLEKVNSIA